MKANEKDVFRNQMGSWSNQKQQYTAICTLKLAYGCFEETFQNGQPLRQDFEVLVFPETSFFMLQYPVSLIDFVPKKE